MPISTKCLINQSNVCLAASPSELNLAQVSGVKSSNTMYSVANTSVLPVASCNKGRMIFVEDISAYRYSDGFEWTNSYDTTCRIARNELWGWGDTNFGAILSRQFGVCRSSPVQETLQTGDWAYVSTGYTHSAFLKTDGTLWSYGANTRGQLGNNSTTGFFTSCAAQEVTSSTDWSTVSAGGNGSNGFTSAIKTDGTLWSWGCNDWGRLATNNCINYSSPVQEVSSSTSWCAISDGGRHAAGIKSDGSLFEWGYTYSTNSLCATSSPIQEITSSTWSKASAGIFHSLAIKTDNTLWAWGQNTTALAYGPLGTGDVINYSSPVQEVSSSLWLDVSTNENGYYSGGIATDGTAYWWGDFKHSSPVQELSSSTDWCVISVGVEHISLLKTNSSLWSIISNCCGSFGDNCVLVTRSCSPKQEITSSTDWCAVSVGDKTTQAIKSVYKGFNEP